MDIDIGSRVRIDIPDETDPDHRHHGKHGEVEDIISDDAALVTGDTEDSQLIRVKLDDGTTIDVRKPDLRPPFA
jgi:hypothetical protein